MMGNYHVRCGVGEKPEMETSEAYLSLLAMPDGFQQILSVMRSRNMFVTIILQNMAQLKALFKKEWESIAGNCDSFLYLGGNERSTHEYVSKMLGKETINSNTFGQTTGNAGHYSRNTNKEGQGQAQRTDFPQSGQKRPRRNEESGELHPRMAESLRNSKYEGDDETSG